MGFKQTLSKGLKGIGSSRVHVSHGKLLTISAILLILFVAFTIRVLPIRWEIPSGTLRLNEFDPYYQYELTNHMVTNGLLSPYTENNGAGWINYQQWYPGGLNMGSSLPSLPMTTAILYNVVTALGGTIDLMSFCALMAPLLGALSVVVMYFVGKDMGGKSVGLLAALILALMPSFIQRSSLGFFDTETVGVLALLTFIFLFLRAIDQHRSFRSMVIYSVGSALAMAYFSAGWGAAYFLIGLAAVFVLVLVLIRRYSQRLLFAYSISFGLGFFIATMVPLLSPHYLTTAIVLPVAGVFVLLCIAELLRHNISAVSKTTIAIAFLAILVGGFVAIWLLGDITQVAGKFISVLNPFARSSQPLIESVAEHRITAWGSIYYELGIGILFFLVGMYFTLKNPTNRNVFLLIFGLTSLYFASSMVRLLILLAPAFALLAANGAMGMLKPFVTLLREAGTTMTSKTKKMRLVGKEYSALAIILVFALLVSSFAFSPQTGGTPRVYGQAYNPITVSAASLPIAPNQPVPQWLNMLAYTKDNIPGTTVVSAWWDYGYWLTLLGNVTTLADNATVNATQIQNVGYTFMARENRSLQLLSTYNAEYALVFVTLQIQVTTDQNTGQQTAYVTYANFGDEGKWTWMARISGDAQNRFQDTISPYGEHYMDANMTWKDESAFGYFSNATSTQAAAWVWSDQGMNSTVYKMMSWAKQEYATKYGLQNDQSGVVAPTYFLDDTKGGYFAGMELDPNTAVQQFGGLVPLVCLYKIDWAKFNADMGITTATP
jgi:dolichyl-diphosphooligosaccharide---protein glycosyltransferase